MNTFLTVAGIGLILLVAFIHLYLAVANPEAFARMCEADAKARASYQDAQKAKAQHAAAGRQQAVGILGLILKVLAK